MISTSIAIKRLVQDACLERVEENKNKIKSLMNEVQNIDFDIVEIYDRYQIEDSNENYIKETEEQSSTSKTHSIAMT